LERAQQKPSRKERIGSRALEVAENGGKADPSEAKASSGRQRKRLRRWPKGQLYQNVDFFSSLFSPGGFYLLEFEGNIFRILRTWLLTETL
jgi:hypothetical protein